MNFRKMNKKAREAFRNMKFDEVMRMTETHKFMKTCEDFRVNDEWELVVELWSDDEPDRYSWYTEVSVYQNKDKNILFRVWDRYNGELAEDELVFSGILLTGSRPVKKSKTQKKVLEHIERS